MKDSSAAPEILCKLEGDNGYGGTNALTTGLGDHRDVVNSPHTSPHYERGNRQGFTLQAGHEVPDTLRLHSPQAHCVVELGDATACRYPTDGRVLEPLEDGEVIDQLDCEPTRLGKFLVYIVQVNRHARDVLTAGEAVISKAFSQVVGRGAGSDPPVHCCAMPLVVVEELTKAGIDGLRFEARGADVVH